MTDLIFFKYGIATSLSAFSASAAADSRALAAATSAAFSAALSAASLAICEAYSLANSFGSIKSAPAFAKLTTAWTRSIKGMIVRFLALAAGDDPEHGVGQRSLELTRFISRRPHPDILISSCVVRITGIAFGWMGASDDL